MLNSLENTAKNSFERVIKKLSFTVGWLPEFDLNFPSVLMTAVALYFVVPHFSSNFRVLGSFWPTAFGIAVLLQLQAWLCAVATKALAAPFVPFRSRIAIIDLLLAAYDVVAAILVFLPVQLRILAHFRPDLLEVKSWGVAFLAFLIVLVGDFFLAVAVRINTDNGNEYAPGATVDNDGIAPFDEHVQVIDGNLVDEK